MERDGEEGGGMRRSTVWSRSSWVWLPGLWALLAAVVATAGDGPRSVFVKVNGARIRSGPTVRSDVVAVVPFGTRLEALGHEEDWYCVRLADGGRGFVYDELVSRKDVARLWVEDRAAEVHRTPSAYAPVVATLEAGTEVRPVGKRDDWYRVELGEGRAGWVHEDALDDDPPGALWVRSLSASLHAGPSPMSAVVAELAAGSKLIRVGKAGDFYQVRTEDGKGGYVFGRALRDDEPEHLFVDVGEAEIKSDPTEYGSVKVVVASGTELVAFDKVGDFYLVRTPDGVLGWIYDDNVVRMNK